MPFDASPQVETNTVADGLRRAKAVINTPERWCKRSYGTLKEEGGPHCVYGALQCAVRGDFRIFEVFRLGAGTRHIEGWNDAPERTHAEVIEAFDKAIALAEQQP